MIYLDTHVLIQLGERGLKQPGLGPATRRLIESHDLLASPAAVLELELLHEIGRIRPNAAAVISALNEDLGLRVCDLPFRTVVDYAVKEGWARDPFDRLIVANAKVRNADLVTKDERIHRNYSRAVW